MKLLEELNTQTEAIPSSSETPSASTIGKDINILLVDDVASKALALESLLSDLGARIVKASSGTEALRLLLRQEFAVILLDVQMPVMDGFETAMLIRQRKCSESTPIIFVTSIHTHENHVARGYSLGAVDYLFTPIVPEVLKAKVSVFIELSRKSKLLQKQTKELARSNDELEQFAYLASHDLQEPLRMISCYTQLLEANYREKLDQQGQEFISRAVDSCRRMHHLVTDLLTYSRAGKRKKDLEAVDCEAILRQTIEDLNWNIKESSAVVTHDRLPLVVADDLQLGQVFQNLLTNALKFRGKETPKIHISAEKNESEWIFSIRDNGIGINEKYANRIFLIFQRLHAQSEYPGTGIGLALCKKIVEAHGGRIWFDSELGKGTTFYFTIPLKVSYSLD
jgi:two-component system sensor histidine kinase/response regulator